MNAKDTSNFLNSVRRFEAQSSPNDDRRPLFQFVGNEKKKIVFYA